VSRDAFWEFERAGWDRASARYDECWGDTEVFVAALLDSARVGRGSRVLDVACGPGYVSQAAAARGAEATGLDVAAGMVAQARRRSPGLTFVEGDAQRLPFPDESFDAVTMNFGILHLSQPDAAIAEARRVLVPGGRFAFSAWVVHGNAVAQIVDGALKELAEPVDLPEGPPYYRFAAVGECRRALVDAGFDGDTFEMETVTGTWHVRSADGLFDAELSAGVRTGAVLRGQPPDRLEAIRDAIAEGVRRYAHADGFALPIAANVISAAPPS
jgi:SAM-dependent methyltransferase